MDFTVEERFTMLNLLPPTGNLLTMRIVHDLRQALAFSEKDLKVMDIQQTGEQLRWKNGVGPKEIKVGQKAKSIVYGELEKLDKDEKLNASHLLLCEKFEYEG